MSDTRQALVLVMAKMALADGQVSPEEHGFLEALLEPGDTVEGLLATARERSLQELVGPIELYADRFFIALRAACLAFIDIDFDAEEEAMFESLVTALAITPQDRSLILDGIRDLENSEVVPSARIEELFAQSSFC